MIEARLAAGLARWVQTVIRYPWWVIALMGCATATSLVLAVDRFRINADLSDLIEQEAPWRDTFDRFQSAFPHLTKTAVVVISGPGFRQVEDVARRIEAGIRQRPDRFRAIHAGENHPFFRDHALLYLDLDELYDAADRLAEAQPWLTAVAEDPSLAGLLDLLREGVGQDPPAGFDRIVARLDESAGRLLAGEDATFYWVNEFFDEEATWFRLISVKSALEIGETRANAALVSDLRLIVEASVPASGVRVGITGEAALAHEEISAAVSGVQLAGWLSVVLLAAVLIVGVRSLKIILATFSMLFIGIALTAAWAMLAVGEYNTLSIIFMVMFFGLGVDMAIHFSLRYQEAANAGADGAAAALVTSVQSVGGAIAICSVTTALGFLGFWPTDYRGLADLGIISAGGMLIAGFLTFTWLPAFYAVSGPIRAHRIRLPSSARLVNALIARRGSVVLATGVTALLALIVAAESRFDYSVLALKDPDADSMRTLRLLQAESHATDYALYLMDPGAETLTAVEALPEVKSVRGRADLVPEDQAEKRWALADLALLLESALAPQRQQAAPDPEALQAGAIALAQAMRAEADAHAYGDFPARLERMAAEPEQLRRWQDAIVPNLLEEVDWLRRALTVAPITEATVPRAVQAQLIGAEEQQLAIALPAEDVSEVEAMTRFIDRVQAVAPDATGRPVIERGVGEIVVDSFRQALAFALVAITLVLLVMFGNLRHTIAIVIPLALAVLLTLAVGHLLNMPLNMANILVMPLIFGLGVDAGIHVVDRYRSEGDVRQLMHSSTPRAVLLSGLTTVGAFSALALSAHLGTASIGALLAVAVSLLLAFSVFLLPVLLSWLSAR